MENNLTRLTCNVEQSKQLLNLGILGLSFFYFSNTPEGWAISTVLDSTYGLFPAWTKAELDALIGPQYGKPDFWDETRLGGLPNDKRAGDPLSYPVFMPAVCEVFSNGAAASARVLIYLLENEYISAEDANARYNHVFLKPKF